MGVDARIGRMRVWPPRTTALPGCVMLSGKRVRVPAAVRVRAGRPTATLRMLLHRRATVRDPRGLRGRQPSGSLAATAGHELVAKRPDARGRCRMPQKIDAFVWPRNVGLRRRGSRKRERSGPHAHGLCSRTREWVDMSGQGRATSTRFDPRLVFFVVRRDVAQIVQQVTDVSGARSRCKRGRLIRHPC